MSRIGPVLPPGFLLNNQSDSDSDSGDVIGPAPANQKQDNESGSTIGPALPPGFGSVSPERRSSIGPALPPDLNIGPALPLCLDQSDDGGINDVIGDVVNQRTVCGPSLPPDLGKRTVGPALPPDFDQSGTSKKAVVGPALPPGFNTVASFGPAPPPDLGQSDSDSDDDVIGPLPSEISTSGPSAAEEFERRVSKMREKLENKDKPQTQERESWMTELPSIELSAQLGLGARQFRTNDAPKITESDRSQWTTVGGAPKPECSKKRKPEEEFHPDVLAKDRKIAEEVQKYNESSRSKSLMDMHSKKLKKEKKLDPDEKPERVPFDRERDLNTKKFDDAQRAAILKKAAKLDSRFSHGAKKYI